MKYFKVKTKSSATDELTPFETQPLGSVMIQAVYYSSENPSKHLCLYDGDGDMFMYPIPGQIENKIVTPEIPITVKLPIRYLDQDGENEIIVFGQLE